MVVADSDRVSRAPPYLGFLKEDLIISFTGLSPSMVQLPSWIQLWLTFVTLCTICNLYFKSRYPLCKTIAVYHVHKVWALPISLAATFRIIWLFSFRPVTKMFQFTGFPSLWLFYSSEDHQVLTRWGFPIRISTDQDLLAVPRGLSQLYTSFVGCQYQGIPH